MKKYMKHAIKSALVGYGAMFSVMIVVSLGVWFVTFDFPQEILTFNKDFRVAVVWVVCISLFVGTCMYDGRTDEEKVNADKALIDHLIRKNQKLELALKQKINAANGGHHACNNKTTATDIALGVGVGVVGAEIVSNILDL